MFPLSNYFWYRSAPNVRYQCMKLWTMCMLYVFSVRGSPQVVDSFVFIWVYMSIGQYNKLYVGMFWDVLPAEIPAAVWCLRVHMKTVLSIDNEKKICCKVRGCSKCGVPHSYLIALCWYQRTVSKKTKYMYAVMFWDVLSADDPAIGWEFIVQINISMSIDHKYQKCML